jgi:brefeldin A-inhibited guanine nucleotide-exchange protein 3
MFEAVIPMKCPKQDFVFICVGFVLQAACHKERAISKKAVACIHDTVTAVLNEQAELPHFHFNEALFKPFENLLCLELCDADVQDQVG